MIVVEHRRNTRRELDTVPPEHGVEIDLRSQGSRLIVAHDPFADGEDLDAWLDGYRNRLLILNTKEEGLESELLDRMSSRGIADFFFLDQSFPFLVRTTRAGERRCAVRYSDREPVELALGFAGQADWVWVDHFERFPMDAATEARLRAAGFRLCLVSPELQGADPARVVPFRRALEAAGVTVDAVCTRQPEAWRNTHQR